MNLEFIFNGGESKRYHTVDTIKTQDIAAHSFGVAWLCEILTEGYATKSLIMCALAHDLAEHIVGDLPSPSKRAMSNLAAEAFNAYEEDVLTYGLSNKYSSKIVLSKDEQRTLRLADMFDGMLFCLRERQLGNTKIGTVYVRFKDYVLEQEPLTSTETRVFHEINHQWRSINERR